MLLTTKWTCSGRSWLQRFYCSPPPCGSFWLKAKLPGRPVVKVLFQSKYTRLSIQMDGPYPNKFTIFQALTKRMTAILIQMDDEGPKQSLNIIYCNIVITKQDKTGKSQRMLLFATWCITRTFTTCIKVSRSGVGCPLISMIHWRA